MFLSRGRRTALSLPFAASVWLVALGLGAPAEGSYGVLTRGRGPDLVTLDPEGNRTSTTTPKGQTTSTTYDELGKLTKVTQPPPNPALDPTPLVTEYAYDENRNRILQTDANLHSVKMEYDGLNRLKKTTQDPGGLDLVTETVKFDEDGNPEIVKDPKGQTTTSAYDELNRLKKKSFAFAEGDGVRPWRYTAWIDYGYDENGNVLTTDEHVASGTDPPTTLTTTRAHDGLDRLTSESQPLPDGGTRTVGYSYYRNGLRKTVTDPAGSVTQYAYDGQNRLQTAVTAFATADAKTTAYTYWPDDLLHTVSYPNGVVATHGYDKADRLLTLTNAKGATPVSSYTYTYDPNGNRLTQVEVNGGQTETTGYGYDDLDRLASVTYPVDAAYPQGRVVSYGYDAVGNRTRETEKNSADALLADKQGIFDPANRLTELQDLVSPAESTSFTWDANGNQLTKATGGTTTENRYDLRDKLVEVVQGASTLGRFQYDTQGRRSLKIGEEGLRQYVYDQTSLFAEYDGDGNQKALYSYGSDRLISLARADEGRRYFSLDGLRSVVNLTNELGAPVASYHLDTWGNFRFPTELDASRNRFAFTGHIFDTETGLYNAKARYFDPKLGRFLTQDSYLGQIDQPPSLHRYAYARNQPTLYVDPDGNVAIVDNLVGGVASVAIGWGMSRLTGQEYQWKDAAVDFGLGFATSGLSSLTKLKHASKLAQWGTRAATEAVLDAGAEVARKEWKGEDYTAGGIATGAAANFAIGEAGAAVGRKVTKWWRGASQAQKAVNIEESRLGRGEAPEPGASADVSARPAGNSAAPPPVADSPATHNVGDVLEDGRIAGDGPGAAANVPGAFLRSPSDSHLLDFDATHQAARDYLAGGGKGYLRQLETAGQINSADALRIRGLSLLQRVVNRQNERLSRPGAFEAAVSGPQLAALRRAPFLERRYYGSTLEDAVAARIARSGPLSNLFEHVGHQAGSGMESVDFLGRSAFEGLEFDVTTVGRLGSKYIKYGEDVLVPTYTR